MKMTSKIFSFDRMNPLTVFCWGNALHPFEKAYHRPGIKISGLTGNSFNGHIGFQKELDLLDPFLVDILQRGELCLTLKKEGKIRRGHIKLLRYRRNSNSGSV